MHLNPEKSPQAGTLPGLGIPDPEMTMLYSPVLASIVFQSTQLKTMP